MMRRPSQFDLCRTSAIRYTEAVLNETENDPRTYQIVYRMASRERVTESHPGKITVERLNIGIE
jgi:hypothetical protein